MLVQIFIYMHMHALLINITLHLGHYMFLVEMLLALPRKPSNSLRGHGIVVPRKNSAVGFFLASTRLGNQWLTVPLYKALYFFGGVGFFGEGGTLNSHGCD